MKRFIKNLSLVSLSLILTILLINIAIYTFIDPAPRAESKRYIEKIHFLEEHKESLDTIFFGSSKIYRQINPALYDSLTNHKSFNFGIASCFPPSCTKKFNKLSELIRSSNIKTVFFELGTLAAISDYQESEELYYNFTSLYDFETILFHSGEFRMDLLSNVVKATFHKYTRGLRLLFYEVKNYKNRSFEDSLGFQPLDYEKAKAIYSRHEAFIKNPVIRNSEWRENLTDRTNHSITLYQDYLARILNKYKDAGIQVVLLISPSSNPNLIYQQHSEFLKQNMLPILNFSSKKRYPNLYQIENFFDLAHLNKQGAKIYTRLIAEEWSQLAPEFSAENKKD